MKAVFLISCILILFNCSSPSDDNNESPDGFGSVSGIVVDSLGGSAVSGSIVIIEELPEFSAVTDENGFFRIDNVPEGYHTLLVNKSGMAGSRLQNIYVWDEETTHTEIIQPNYDFSYTLTVPPVINVSGIETNETCFGTVPIEVNVEEGSCPVISTACHNAIYIKIGSYSDLLYDAVSSSSSLSYIWVTDDFASNLVNIKIISYDINNNRSELNIPVYVGDIEGPVPATKPMDDHYYIAAITYGNSLDILKNIKSINPETFPYLPEEIMNIPADRSKAAEQDSSIIVYLNLDVLQDTTGIYVYRSSEKNTGYVLAGKTTYIRNPDDSNPVNHDYQLQDCSSGISPGTLWYRICYFNEHGQGPLSEPIEVTVLPKYNLFLTYPEDNSVVTIPDPTLKWEADVIQGATRYDSIYLWNFSTGETHVDWSDIENGGNEFPIFPLPYNCIFEWNVCSYYMKGEYSVRAYSIPSNDQNYDSSTNGAFRFTVIEPPVQ